MIKTLEYFQKLDKTGASISVFPTREGHHIHVVCLEHGETAATEIPNHEAIRLVESMLV